MREALRVCKKCQLPKPLTSFPVAVDCDGGRRSTCRRCKAGKPPLAPVVPEPPPKRFFRVLDSKRYIITSAQNNTPVHAGFLDTLKVAAKHLDAELVVIPYRYKNPTSQGESNQTYWWDTALVPYLHNVRKKLNENLILCADVKIQPTASSPLTGFEALTGAESCIIGAPKMAFKAIAVPSGRYPKILTTTGACTQSDYSDTKAGKIGAFHHFLGAVVIEIQGKTFHLRQVNADRLDGSFTDLDKHYTPTGVEQAPPALGLVMGDTHVRVTDLAVDNATFFQPGGIVETLNPQTLVWHDLIDGETTNPHEVGNPFLSEAKRKAGRQDVKAEIQEVVEFVNKRAKGRAAVIVDSNHHDFLARWMIRTDWKQDLKNAVFYLETALATLASAKMGPGGAEYSDPFPYWLKKLGVGTNARCLGPDESFKIAGIECGMHGHRGPNGAKGALKNLSRLGSKTITGHSHTPGIEEGAYAVGTSTPRRLAYAHGPGSWLNTHCVVYATGKRALITIIDGAWRIP